MRGFIRTLAGTILGEPSIVWSILPTPKARLSPCDQGLNPGRTLAVLCFCFLCCPLLAEAFRFLQFLLSASFRRRLFPSCWTSPAISATWSYDRYFMTPCYVPTNRVDRPHLVVQISGPRCTFPEGSVLRCLRRDTR